MIAQVQEAWKRGVIAGVLLMDVAAALPSVTRGLLLRKMRNAGLDERPVRWTDSFMRDRWVVTSVDGQDGEEMSATTGLPQDTPVSPVLIALYITEIHQAVESKIEGCQGISFADGATWIVEGYDISGVATGLKRCAKGQSEVGKGQCCPFRDGQDRGDIFLAPAKAPPLPEGDPGRRPDGSLLTRCHPVAGHMVGLRSPVPREPPPQDRQSPPGRG